MSLHKAAFALAGALLLSGCGFEPIAAPVNPSAGQEEAAVRLRTLDVKSENKRFTYHMRRSLNRRVVVDETAPVRLLGDTDIIEQGLAIEQNDTVTRLNLTARTRYRLVGAQGDPISQGEIETVTAVNATTDLYATQVSREEAIRRLAEETARRLISVLLVENAKAGSQI